MDFISTLARIRSQNDFPLLRRIVEEKCARSQMGPGEVDEMAFPAYFLGNPLSRLVFLGRLARFLPMTSFEPGARVLDFGCGSGLLGPFLASYSCDVVAVDLFPDVAIDYSQRLGLPIRHATSLDELDDGRFDRILALDVLEHVDDLDALWRQFGDRLISGGQLLVSGPTENALYRLGRKIVGFSGDYHCRTIDDIFRSAEAAGFRRERTSSWPAPGPACLFRAALLV